MSDLERLHVVVEDFCRFIEKLPEEVMVEATWGPKEVLAQLVIQHESYLTQIRHFLKGKPLEPPKSSYRDLKIQAISISQGEPVDVLLSRLREANDALCKIYAMYDPSPILMEIEKGTIVPTTAVEIPGDQAQKRQRQNKVAREIKSLKNMN